MSCLILSCLLLLLVLFLSLFIIQILIKVCQTWSHSQHKRADRDPTNTDITRSSTTSTQSSVQISDPSAPPENKLRVYVNSDRVSFDGIGARYWLSCIETFLFALAFLQVGIAILGEVIISSVSCLLMSYEIYMCIYVICDM